jgi:hypothetical protein
MVTTQDYNLALNVWPFCAGHLKITLRDRCSRYGYRIKRAVMVNKLTC